MKRGDRMHQPTLRVLRILELLANGSGYQRLSDISRELEIPKSTLMPILQTLCEQQYLNQDSSGRYTVGTALFSLGASFSGCFPIMDFVRQELESLVDKLGETCYCGVLDGADVLYLEKAESPQPLRMLTGVGKRLPAYATALGKSLLIQKSEEELREIFSAGMPPVTKQTVTDASRLAAQLHQAQEVGYTWESEESTELIRCYAVPVYKHDCPVMAISVAIPLFRFREDMEEGIVAALKLHGEHISAMVEKTDAHFGSQF